MADILQFVDEISASPTVRLDLNDDSKWGLNYEGSDFSPPPRKSVWSDTYLADGERQAASKYGNRTIRLALDLMTSSADEQATELQKLWRELDREANWLKYQPAGMTYPVFFRTFASMDTEVVDVPGNGKFRRLRARIDAKSYAFGLEETPVGAALNSNTTFESGTSPWTAQNGAIAQSSAFAHAGTQSLRLTPTGGVSPVGIRSEKVPVTAGLAYTAYLWVYSVAGYATGAQAAIDWYTGGGVFISTTLGTSAGVPAATWTPYRLDAVAPATAAQAEIRALMSGTPAASNVIYVDDAVLSGPVIMHDPALGSGCYLDLSTVKGDVAAPLVIKSQDLTAPTLWSVRRRGTPSAAPFLLQGEDMTPSSVDTSAVVDAAASGGDVLRTTFSAGTSLQGRATATHPATPSEDARGRYRVLARMRQSNGTDVITAQLTWSRVTNTAVTLTSSTAWQIVDLGDVQIPAGTDPVGIGYGPAADVVGISVVLNIGRSSGSGNVDTDYLLFVPADDRLAVVYTGLPATLGYGVFDGVREMAYKVTSAGEIGGKSAEEVPPVVSTISSGSGSLLVSPGVTNRLYVIGVVEPTDLATAHTISGGARVIASYWPHYLHVRAAS